MAITTGILDDFNRADESPLGNGDWSGDVRVTRDPDLESFLVRDDNSGGNECDTLWTNSTFGAGDLEVYATISTLTTSSTSRMYLYCRILQAGVGTSDGYLCLLKGGGGSNQSIQVYSVSNGSLSTVGANHTTAVSNGDVLGMRHDDAGGSDNIEVDLNGTVIFTRTNNTHTGTASLGLGIRNSATRLADFGGGLVTGGAQTISLSPIDSTNAFDVSAVIHPEIIELTGIDSINDLDITSILSEQLVELAVIDSINGFDISQIVSEPLISLGPITSVNDIPLPNVIHPEIIELVDIDSVNGFGTIVIIGGVSSGGTRSIIVGSIWLGSITPRTIQ